MYHLHATVTQTIFGFVIDVTLQRDIGGRPKVIECETWMVNRTEPLEPGQQQQLLDVLQREVSDLAGNLRRVVPSVSESDG